MEKINKKKVKILEALAQESMWIIVTAGSAKSSAIEALQEIKKGNKKLFQLKISEAKAGLIDAEKRHFDLIKRESSGEKIPTSLLLMHAEDQLFSVNLVIILAEELAEVYEIINKKTINL